MKSRLFFSSLFLISLCYSQIVYCAGVVRGFVKDKTSEEPLPAANVVLSGTQRGSSTNLDGYFHIPGVAEGQYVLIATYMGYQTGKIKINVSSEMDSLIVIKLLPSAYRGEEAVFIEDKLDESEIKLKPQVSTIAVKGDMIRQIASLAGENDVMRAMQTVPGVKSSSDLSSALYVRGSNPSMTLIQMDQSTIYNTSHMFGIFSTFNPEAVKHIELMKGAFPAEYGGRAGSVLQVVTKDGNRNEFNGNASVGVVSSRASMEGPLPNDLGSYSISGRRTYMDLVISALDKYYDIDDIPDYFFYDTNGKFNIDITDRTVLTIGAFTGRDKMDDHTETRGYGQQYKMAWGNTAAYTKLRHVLPFDAFLTASVTYSKYKATYDYYNNSDKYLSFDNGFNDLAYLLDMEYYGIKNHKIKTGLQANYYELDFGINYRDYNRASIKEDSWNTSFFLQDQWRLSANWEILPGGRFYYQTSNKKTFFDPRMSLVYFYDTNSRIKLSGGRYHQFLDLYTIGNELISFFDFWIPNDGSYDPVYADQIVVAYEIETSDGYDYTVEAYLNEFHNIHEKNERGDRGNEAGDYFLHGNGRTYGLEFMLRKNSGRWTGWIGYSLAWSKQRFPNSYLNDGDWYYPRWDRRHDFIAVTSYKLNEKWDMSATWQYMTGQGYTRIQGVYSQYNPMIDPSYFEDYGRELRPSSVNNYRLPADHRLDVTFSYNHTFFDNPAKLNICLYNVYNRRGVRQRYYDPSINPVQQKDTKRLPILPLISYEVKF